jgi:hypothetical protein
VGADSCDGTDSCEGAGSGVVLARGTWAGGWIALEVLEDFLALCV